MKWIFTALIAASAVPLHAQQKDARADIAITYLGKIANGDLDVAKHTALSPHCSIARRKVIRERLQLTQKDYLRKNDAYTLETLKEDGRFSAVLVRAEHPSSPLTSRVLAVAMLRTKDGWKPAPLPGSFANTGYGYDEQVEKTVKALERWMATERIKRETALRTRAASKFQSTLAAIEKDLQLKNLGARKAVSKFIELCREKDLMHVLAAMGAASGVLPDPLEDTISTVSGGLESDDKEGDWQMVTNRSTVYEVMNVDDKRSEVAVGFYNPMLRRQSKVLYFPVEKQNGKTFVKLSPMLTIASLPQDERWQQRWRHRRDDERKLVLRIPATILANTAEKPAESPEALLQTFLSIAKANDFRKAIGLIPRKGHHFEKEKEQSVTLANLASLWQGLVAIKSSPKPRISIIRDSGVALAPLQLALPDKPGKFRTWNLWMLKGDSGWHLVPESSMKGIQDRKLRLSMRTLQKRLATMAQAQRKELSEKLLTQVLEVDPAKLRDAVSERDASRLFKQYRGHLRSDDNEAALGCCATLKGTDNTRTLQNFNNALRGVDDHLEDDRILGVVTSGNWSGISARTHSKLTDAHDYPLYLCVNTRKGAKILLDIDLRHASNKGREIINKRNWEKLGKAVPATALKDVESIFARHGKLVAQDMEAERKLHE